MHNPEQAKTPESNTTRSASDNVTEEISQINTEINLDQGSKSPESSKQLDYLLSHELAQRATYNRENNTEDQIREYGKKIGIELKLDWNDDKSLVTYVLAMQTETLKNPNVEEGPLLKDGKWGPVSIRAMETYLTGKGTKPLMAETESALSAERPARGESTDPNTAQKGSGLETELSETTSEGKEETETQTSKWYDIQKTPYKDKRGRERWYTSRVIDISGPPKHEEAIIGSSSTVGMRNVNKDVVGWIGKGPRAIATWLREEIIPGMKERGLKPWKKITIIGPAINHFSGGGSVKSAIEAYESIAGLLKDFGTEHIAFATVQPINDKAIAFNEKLRKDFPRQIVDTHKFLSKQDIAQMREGERLHYTKTMTRKIVNGLDNMA